MFTNWITNLHSLNNSGLMNYNFEKINLNENRQLLDLKTSSTEFLINTIEY